MPNHPAQEKRTCATCGDRTRKWTKTETGYQCENCAPPNEGGSEEMSKKPYDRATDPAIEERTIKKMLRVILTGEEKADLAERMAEHRADLQRLEDEKKQITKDFASRIELAQGTIRQESSTYLQGWEMRDVECIEITDKRAGFLTVVRQDTGEEVSRRKLTAEEMELKLPMDAAA